LWELSFSAEKHVWLADDRDDDDEDITKNFEDVGPTLAS